MLRQQLDKPVQSHLAKQSLKVSPEFSAKKQLWVEGNNRE